MKIEEIRMGMAMLQASYPTMGKLDEASLTAYIQELGPLNSDDFEDARVLCVRNLKFFPTISEFLEAADTVVRKRMEAKEREDREKRLALKASEDAIMDPKSGIHRTVVGPNHQIFLDYLSGKRTFPDPEWMKRKKPVATNSSTKNENGYVPITDAQRSAREQLLRQQAAQLLSEPGK